MMLQSRGARRSAPAPVPFPILHVDTGHNFPEVIEFRDKHRRAATACGSIVASVQESDRRRPCHQGVRPRTAKVAQPPPDHGRCSTRSKSGGFDAVVRRWPARRGASARAKERVLLLPRQIRPVGSRRTSGPSCGSLYNGRHPQGRAHPRLPDLRLDRARRLAATWRAKRSSSYRRSTSPTSARWSSNEGLLYGQCNEFFPLPEGSELVHVETVRYRTVGDVDPAPAPSSPPQATDYQAVDRGDLASTRITERGATRADDRATEAAMEDRKREGYF